ncbi:MAG: hypothetical protein EXQ58_11580 [Acidobacteria bacterium]|nr:hypothetical protein [Acidobacteriota bacterium]
MRTSRALGLVVVCIVAVALGSQQVFPQDPVRVASKNVKVIFENDRVRVLEVRLKPGEKVPMHSHPAHLTYTVSNFKGKYSVPDGETTLAEGKTSAWSWTEAITHAGENVGTTEIHTFAIELKEPPRRTTGATEKSAPTKKNQSSHLGGHSPARVSDHAQRKKF